MGRTKIDWPGLTHVLNTVSGCEHGCPGCYAERFCKRFPKVWPNGFKPTLHEEAFKDKSLWNTKRHYKFFVVSMGDLFGGWVPKEWIERTLYVCKQNPQHEYMFLTKNPQRYNEFNFSGIKAWLGTSIDGRSWHNDECRLYWLHQSTYGYPCEPQLKRFISIEPLLGEVTPFIRGCRYDLAIAGAQSGAGAIMPSSEAIRSLRMIPKNKLYIKKSLKKIINAGAAGPTKTLPNPLLKLRTPAQKKENAMAESAIKEHLDEDLFSDWVAKENQQKEALRFFGQKLARQQAKAKKKGDEE